MVKNKYLKGDKLQELLRSHCVVAHLYEVKPLVASMDMPISYLQQSLPHMLKMSFIS